MTKTVDLTSYDITHGVRESPWDCPFAKAMSRAFDHPIMVLPGSWGFFDDRVYHTLPSHVTEAIFQFDTTGRLEPMTFEIEYG